MREKQMTTARELLTEDSLEEGALYIHHKGGTYQLICIAKMEINQEKMVVYSRFLSSRTENYIRPTHEFLEKFKRVK